MAQRAARLRRVFDDRGLHVAQNKFIRKIERGPMFLQERAQALRFDERGEVFYFRIIGEAPKQHVLFGQGMHGRPESRGHGKHALQTRIALREIILRGNCARQNLPSGCAVRRVGDVEQIAQAAFAAGFIIAIGDFKLVNHASPLGESREAVLQNIPHRNRVAHHA